MFHPSNTSNQNHRRSVQKHHKINGNTYNNTSGAVATGLGLGLGEFSLTNQNTNDTLANVRVNKSSTNRMEGDF